MLNKIFRALFPKEDKIRFFVFRNNFQESDVGVYIIPAPSKSEAWKILSLTEFKGKTKKEIKKQLTLFKIFDSEQEVAENINNLM